MSEAIFVGIDVAKDTFVVASAPTGVSLCLPNNANGAGALLEALKSHRVALVVLEATGAYERNVASALLHAGIPVVVANPRQVRDFARGLGTLAKTDSMMRQSWRGLRRSSSPNPGPRATSVRRRWLNWSAADGKCLRC